MGSNCMPPPERNPAEPWFALSEADLMIARWVAGLGPSAPEEIFGLGCFHCQQAAEKAIKAVLACLDLPQPYTHDLHALLRPIRAHHDIAEHVLDAADALADYGVGPRYPSPRRLGSHAFAARAVADAEAIVDWARGLVAGSQ
jgi:HEPN domain-containing protein